MARALTGWIALKPPVSLPIRSRPPRVHQIRLLPTSARNSGGDTNYLRLTDEDLMRQCEMDTFKASGPGGQHRNKRESAVRLKHLPTGIVAQAVEDRSQHQNRATALVRLRTLLALKDVLSEQRMEEMLALVARLRGFSVQPGTPDRHVWDPGTFSCQRAYRVLRNRPTAEDDLLFRDCRLIWKVKAPLKVRFFAWLCRRQRLVTGSLRAGWGRGYDPTCRLCGSHDEDVQHLLTTCEGSTLVWEVMGLTEVCDVPQLWNAFRRADPDARGRRTRMLAILWSIWLCRNDVVFNGSVYYSENVVSMARSLCGHWIELCI